MRGKNNAFSEKRSTKSTNSFQTIASSSSSSMSANTNSTSTNPKYKNRRIFHVDSDNSEPSEPDDYDILEEVDEDQGSYVSSTRRSRGYRDNKSDDYQEKSAGRKSRSLSSLATRERSPPTNSLKNRRGRTLPRTTSESPLKHQPPPTDKIPEEEDASKLDRRKKYDPGIYNRRRQNKILRTRPSESSSFGDGVRLSKYGTWKEIRKTQREKKLEKEELNTLREDIRDSLSSLDYITEKELSEGGIIHSIYGKIRNDSFLNSICTYNKDILSMIVSVYTSFGSKMIIQTRTQIMIWHILEKLRRFWMYTNQALPTYQEILQDSETVEFLKSIAYLSYMVMNTDACILTGFLENDRAKHKLYISFRHHGIKVEKKRLDTFDIAEYAEDGYGLGGSGMEVQLADCPLVEFLASIHSHTSTKNEPLSKNKILEGLPFLCGLSSEDGSESQKIVRMFLEALSGIPSPNIRKPSHYLDSLSRLWEETQLVFLTCVYEARLRKIQIFPPPDNSKVINLGLTKLHQHELICLSWYLANLDSETVNLEVLMLQDCDIDDDGIKLLGKCIFQKPKKLLLTGNQLSMDGLHSCFKMWKQNDKCYLRSLDMSNCSLDDECLSKLTPILSSLEEIYLNDNYFTWYGVRKISTTRRKTKRLKKIELGRCNINDHAFYELIPLILRTEVVILDGNDLYPLELRIFARHLKEKAGEGSNAMKLKTLVLSNCNLLDDCLFELSRCITYVPNVDLRNNKFTIEGLRTLAKFCRKRDMGELKAINLRGCGITSDEVGELSDVLVKFETLNLAGNNLKGKTGIEEFCQALSSQEVKLKFIDLRHCRLHEHSQKLIQDTCRKLKIDHKIF
ncbi:uncharacterized protein [Lepeophtheirus salmonis]|uniref:uncharacterized protein n=1 Tax=Lepeophtheirus salmonis TaxID=72036 RepID=UPI001AE90C1B|nr:uncharacterized protein LOC121117780 [Lepeophtheirus salmonis]